MRKADFQDLAVKTESIVDEITTTDDDMRAFECSLEAIVHIIDVLDKYKKNFFYGKELNHQELIDRLAYAKNMVNYGIEDLIRAMNTPKETADMVTLDIDPRVFHALLGTITEHGEIASALLEGMSDEEGIDLVNICEELGDSDWYKALFYEATGISWSVVQSMIIKKLEIRYSGKFFTQEEAESRDLVAERQLLNNTIAEAVAEYNAQYVSICDKSNG